MATAARSLPHPVGLQQTHSGPLWCLHSAEQGLKFYLEPGRSQPVSLPWHTWPAEKTLEPGASSSLGCKHQGSGKLAAASSTLSPAPSLGPHPWDRGCPNLLEEFATHTCTHTGRVGGSWMAWGGVDHLCLLDSLLTCAGVAPIPPTSLEALDHLSHAPSPDRTRALWELEHALGRAFWFLVPFGAGDINNLSVIACLEVYLVFSFGIFVYL